MKKLERQRTKEKVAGLNTNGLSGRMAVKRPFISKGNWVRKRLKYATLDGRQRDNTVSTASLKQRISVHFSYLFGDVHQTVITISKTSGFSNTHASEVKLYPDRKTYNLVMYWPPQSPEQNTIEAMWLPHRLHEAGCYSRTLEHFRY